LGDLGNMTPNKKKKEMRQGVHEKKNRLKHQKKEKDEKPFFDSKGKARWKNKKKGQRSGIKGGRKRQNSGETLEGTEKKVNRSGRPLKHTQEEKGIPTLKSGILGRSEKVRPPQ